MGCSGRAFCDCTRLTVGCLEVEEKVEKGKEVGDLGRTKKRK